MVSIPINQSIYLYLSLYQYSNINLDLDLDIPCAKDNIRPFRLYFYCYNNPVGQKPHYYYHSTHEEKDFKQLPSLAQITKHNPRS